MKRAKSLGFGMHMRQRLERELHALVECHMRFAHDRQHQIEWRHIIIGRHHRAHQRGKPARLSAPGTFGIKRIERFDITDAALLPAGDLLILQRQPARGTVRAVRRIQIGDIKPGWSGPVRGGPAL